MPEVWWAAAADGLWALEDLNLRPLPCQGWHEHCESAGGSIALTKPLVSAFYWVPWYP
jgi:hypothetical protein